MHEYLAGNRHIFVVDDDEGMRKLLSIALKQAGFGVSLARDTEEALDILLNPDFQTPVDLLLTDFIMPGLSGLELINVLKTHGIRLQTCIMSGQCDDALKTKARASGCVALLEKPFELHTLFKAIDDAFKRSTSCDAISA